MLKLNQLDKKHKTNKQSSNCGLFYLYYSNFQLMYSPSNSNLFVESFSLQAHFVVDLKLRNTTFVVTRYALWVCFVPVTEIYYPSEAVLHQNLRTLPQSDNEDK